MINSVSNVSFKANSAELLSAPGKFSQTPVAKTDAPADEFVGKKKSKAPAVMTTLALALAAFIGLGVAVKKGKLAKVENAEGFMAKIKNVGASIGGAAESCWNKITGIFGKKGEKVAEAVEEVVETAAENAAETVAK